MALKTLALADVAAGDGSQLMLLAALLVTGLALALGIIGWLNVSGSPRARRWRERHAHAPHALDGPSSKDASAAYPHLHVVDGVTITHAHAGGEHSHEHSSITVSMSHYAQLVKRAQRRQSS